MIEYLPHAFPPLQSVLHFLQLNLRPGPLNHKQIYIQMCHRSAC